MTKEQVDEFLKVDRFAFTDETKGPETEEVATHRNQVYWLAVKDYQAKDQALRDKGIYKRGKV